MLRFTGALLPFVVTILEPNLGLGLGLLGLVLADAHEVEMNHAARNLRGKRSNDKQELCFDLRKRKLGDFGLQVRLEMRKCTEFVPKPLAHVLLENNQSLDRQRSIRERSVVLERSRCD